MNSNPLAGVAEAMAQLLEQDAQLARINGTRRHTPNRADRRAAARARRKGTP